MQYVYCVRNSAIFCLTVHFPQFCITLSFLLIAIIAQKRECPPLLLRNHQFCRCGMAQLSTSLPATCPIAHGTLESCTGNNYLVAIMYISQATCSPMQQQDTETFKFDFGHTPYKEQDLSTQFALTLSILQNVIRDSFQDFRGTVDRF